MYRRRAESGFTMIEIAFVVVLIALMAAIVAPNLSAYARRQDARKQAQRIADLLNEARELAVQEGNNYMVIFDQPNPGDVRIIDDDNGDSLINGGEFVRDVTFPPPGLHQDVAKYNPATSPPVTTVVPEEGGAIPPSGMTFPAAGPTFGLAFTPRGFPVQLPAAANPPGSGTGTYYVTDNTDVVYAVTLLPLGGTRVRVYRSATDDWF